MTLGLMQSLSSHMRAAFGCLVEDSTLMKVWQGLSAAIVDQIADSWVATTERYARGHQKRYFSAEFLMGRALFNNLSNLDLAERVREALTAYGLDPDQVLGEELDAALGNGGLGRSTACFLDSCVTFDLPVHGYGILYHCGLFKQPSDGGFQIEYPDPWTGEEHPFVTRREERARIVSHADPTVRAVPCDIAITGYGTKNVGTLCLWRTEPIEGFDYDAFNSQRFTDATADRECTMDIPQAPYPNGTTFEGKVLHVRQQYFSCSASLQEIVVNYVYHRGTDLNGFAEFNAVQLDDTHPVLAIPELMHILMDEHDLGREEAQRVASKTFAYANHAVLAEALETWDIRTFNRLFPRIAEIIREIDRRLCIDMAGCSLDQAMVNYMAPVADNTVRMAWIACYGSCSINGVAALHTEIIKHDTLKEWYVI